MSVRGGRIARDQRPRRLDRERQAGQLRTEPVVEIAAQPPPLLLARAHQALAGLLDCLAAGLSVRAPDRVKQSMALQLDLVAAQSLASL